jgi:dihydrofolate synthase/folylpolyglutamate synthase
MLANKQGPEIVSTLLAPGDRAWIVPVPGHSSWSRDALAEACPALAQQLHAAPSLEAALSTAGAPCEATAVESNPTKKPTKKPTQWAQQPIVVAGSLYLIGHLLTLPAEFPREIPKKIPKEIPAPE